MVHDYMWWVFIIPITWFVISLIYQVIKLFKLWIKYKLENIKVKELQLWD